MRGFWKFRRLILALSKTSQGCSADYRTARSGFSLFAVVSLASLIRVLRRLPFRFNDDFSVWLFNRALVLLPLLRESTKRDDPSHQD
jgi:hypothetical protein